MKALGSKPLMEAMDVTSRTTLSTLRFQEETSYAADDWLPHSDQLDADCRQVMIAWCIQISEYAKVGRDTVEIAIRMIDRFMSSGQAKETDRLGFQLVCMTCLYVATKIHEEVAMAPSIFARFSDGIFSVKDIVQKERHILQVLQWKVNPPTTRTFLQYFLETLVRSNLLESSLMDRVLDLLHVQMQNAIQDYQYVLVPASVVAFCALVNALECLHVEHLSDIRQLLSRSIALDCDSLQIQIIQSKLKISIEAEYPCSRDDESTHKRSRDASHRVKEGGTTVSTHSMVTARESPRAVSHRISL